MSVPLEQFQQQIVASGLMSGEELAAWIDQLPSDTRPQDSRRLAQRDRLRRRNSGTDRLPISRSGSDET